MWHRGCIGGWLLMAAPLFGCEQEPAAPHQSETAPTVHSVVAAEPAAASGPSPAELALASVQRGRDWVVRFECGRCHEGANLPSIGPERHCVGCHQRIERGEFDGPKPALRDFRRNIRNLREVPSLDHVATLLRPEWVTEFLLAPHDQRPGLGATMPRLDVSREQANDIVAYLSGAAEPLEVIEPVAAESVAAESFDRQLIERGKRLFVERRCGDCHAFEVPARAPAVESEQQARARRLAPDLRLARQRLRADRIVPWLLDPRAIKPSALMPNFGLSGDEARALARYVLQQPLQAVERVVPERLALLERPVSYLEVEQRVLRKVCWHCHAQPELAHGDGGPGMTGGFGFAPRGLDLSTYSGVLSGYRDQHGKGQSVFRTDQTGTALLVRVLLARQREEAGELGALRGMPLGFPALSPEQIQLVESWVAQGRPE